MTRAATPAAVAVVTIIVAVTARIVVGVRQIPRQQHGTIRIVGHARVVGTETVGVGIIRTLRYIVVGTLTSGRRILLRGAPCRHHRDVNSAITANAERRNID
jgi:hypothetical protein